MTDSYRPENPCPVCADKSTKLELAIAWIRVHVDAGHVILGSLFVITWALTFGIAEYTAEIGWSVVGASILLPGVPLLVCEFDVSDSVKRASAAAFLNAAALAVALALTT